MEIIYKKSNLTEYIKYNFSSAEDSNISDSNFGCSENEDLIVEPISK